MSKRKNEKKSTAKQIAEAFTEPYVVMADPLGSYTGVGIAGDNATARMAIRTEVPTQDADDL